MAKRNKKQAAVAAPVLYKFTNRAESGDLDTLLAMFYKGTYSNKIGIMEAYNLDTEEVDIILVGIELDENGKPDCYPLARGLRSAEASRYLAPNGVGGFYDPRDPREAEEVKERMKPVDVATEDTLQEVFNG